jgi:hypothetical protein
MLGMPVDAGAVPMPEVGLVTCARAKPRFTQRQLAAMLCLTPNLLSYRSRITDVPTGCTSGYTEHARKNLISVGS